MSHFFLGIRINGDVLRLALISRRLSEAQVIDRLAIESLRERPQTEIQTETAKFLAKNKAAAYRSVLVISRDQFIVRKLDLPVEAETNLPKIVEYQVAALLPSEDAPVCYDFFVSKAGKAAKTIGVTAFVLLKSAVEEKLHFCEKAGLKVEKVVPSSAVLASCLEALPAPLRIPAMIFCHAHGQRCELASSAGGVLHQVQELPCSSEKELQEAVQREARILRTHAQIPEESPVNIFLFPPPHEVWKRENEGPLLKLHPITSLDQFGFSLGRTAPDARQLKDDFLTVMAALTSFKRKNACSVNLLPPEKRIEKPRWLWAPIYALAGVNLILLLALGLRQPVQQELYSRQLQQEIRRLEPEVKKIRQVETEIETYQKRAELLANFRKPTTVGLGTLNELSTILPKNSWVTSFVLKEQIVEITGMSDEAAKLLQILDGSPYFRNAEFTAPITRDAVGKEVFRVRMRLEASSPQPSLQEKQ